MLVKRLVIALMILMLLVGCGSNPARDDSGPSPQGAQTSGASPDGSTSDNTAGPATDHSGGGGVDFNGMGNIDSRAALVIIVVIVAAIAVTWTVDYIRDHSSSRLKGSVQDGIYHADDGIFSVAVPGDYYQPHSRDGVEVREVRDQGQQQVVFLPAKEGNPLYGASMQQQLSASDAVMSLDDYADKLHPAPASNDPAALGKPLQPVLDEKLTLDGKPALFREYIQQGTGGSPPVYYLLYFIRTTARGALLSITWTKDCPKCATGPEAEIRAMDPHLQQFVESFHMEKRP